MIKHKLKQILIKSKLLSIVSPIYERIDEVLANFSSENKNHQKQMLDFYSQFIKEGDLCFDVGAHVGNRTEIFLKLGARVVAVEPQEKCFRYLEKRFSKNPNFFLIKKGLSDKEEELVLSVCEEANSISTFSGEWKTGRFANYEWNKRETVLCTTLDNLIKEFGKPDFCKIDVEGFESQVLKGLSQPVGYLSFEFTKEFFETTKLCLDHLLSLGPVQFNCSFGESMQFLFSEWIPAERLCEKIDSISDNLLWGDIYAKFSRK
jgi:FkbM family methyltransferase